MLHRIANGRTDLIHDWLASGGDAETEIDGASLARWCAYYGDVCALRLLVAEGVSLETLGFNHGLNGAAFHGHWQLCEYLIEAGANVNLAEPETGETPLHVSFCSHQSSRHAEVARVLLNGGADPNVRCADGAATGSFMRDVRTVGETPLHRAAAYGTADAIDLLITRGAQIDARDSRGDSPLTWASRALRSPAFLRLLVFPPHSVSPDYRPMRHSLVGRSVSEGEG